MSESHTFADYGERLRAFIEQHAPQNPPSRCPAPSESDLEFSHLAIKLFRLQRAHLPLYDRFCQGRGVTDAIRNWREIPALPIAAFKETDVTSLPATERTAVFHSSGTTAQVRSRHFHSPESLSIYEASLQPPFVRHLMADLDELVERERLGPLDELPFLLLTPPPDLAPHSSLVHMFESVRRTRGSRDSVFVGTLDGEGNWQLDFDRALFALRKSMCANRPLVLMGTAFSFVHLLDHFAAQNMRYRLAEGSRVMETGGYKGRSRVLAKADLHALITRHLGIPETHIVCEYGMSELSSQAYDHVAGAPRNGPRSFRFPPWARVRIISPENGRPCTDGETGLLQILDLANVRSVLAIQTEDLAVAHGEAFELIGRAAQAEARGCSLMTP